MNKILISNTIILKFLKINYFFLIYLIFNFIIIVLGGDEINYGYLYPFEWFKNVLEALLLYWMFFGNVKEYFHFKKKIS